MVQVGSKAPRADLAREISVGRSDDAHIDAQELVRTDALDLAFLMMDRGRPALARSYLRQAERSLGSAPAVVALTARRLRLLGRNYVSNRTGESDNSILLQVELTGLSSVGSRSGTFLESAIRGYSPATSDTRNRSLVP